MTLARRTRPKMRQDAPRTEYKRHQAFVRKHECIVPRCATGMRIECCHVRKGLPANTPSWARAGKDMRPHDAFCFSGCLIHHAEQHNIGEATFAKNYRINLLREALDLARRSPCEEVRMFVRDLKL